MIKFIGPVSHGCQVLDAARLQELTLEVLELAVSSPFLCLIRVSPESTPPVPCILGLWNILVLSDGTEETLFHQHFSSARTRQFYSVEQTEELLLLLVWKLIF